MARIYEYTGLYGYIKFDFDDQIIYVEDTISSLEIQELLNASREAEYSALGMSFPKICNASGKDYLDYINGVQVGITFVLLEDWKIYSEKLSGVFKVLGGNLIQVSGGDPFIANVLITYINILSAASTIVQISTGSGLSTEEHNHLLSIPAETLTDTEHDHLLAIPTSGSSLSAGGLTAEEHERLFLLPLSAGLTVEESGHLLAIPTSGSGLSDDEHLHLLNIPEEDRLKEMLYNRNNTIKNKKITQSIAGGDAVIKVTYDKDGIPIKEELQ
jgi:hypothetical protein